MEEVAPGVLRIRAPNASPMTFTGTNSYVIGGDGPCAVIDPGPDDAAHLDAIAAAIGARGASHILVTHAHRDHSLGAPLLAARLGVPVLAFGGATSGRSAVMDDLAAAGLSGGGEGLDLSFAPDITLTDGDRVEGPGWRLEAVHTPGHLGGHLCFALGDVLFSGDHVMGWASSLVSPPDGDLTDFMTSCRRLAARAWSRLLPGHGEPVVDAAQRLDWLITHRQGRETAILGVLTGAGRAMSVGEITDAVYTDVAPPLLPAAARNVLAHLVDLTTRGRVQARPALSERARFFV